MQESTLWMIGVAIITPLVSVVGIFWKMHIAEKKETKEELKTIRASHTNLTGEVGELRGRVTLSEELIPTTNRIEKLTEKVLAEVSSQNNV